jgi:uncharacterized membrane protein
MHAMLARLRKLLVTGFIFIMPVLITIAVLMRFEKNLLKVGSALNKLLRINSVLGPAGDAVMAVVFFLSICVVAGLLVRISFLKRVSERMDRKLNDLVPGYSQIRSQATKTVGVRSDDEHHFDACLVKVRELSQPGYIIEENPDGTDTVFVPQAPSFTTGQVYVVDPSRIKKLDIDSAALNADLKRLGRGIMSHMRAS